MYIFKDYLIFMSKFIRYILNIFLIVIYFYGINLFLIIYLLLSNFFKDS